MRKLQRVRRLQQLSAGALFVAVAWPALLAAEPVAVRYTEGSLHGFVALWTLDDRLLHAFCRLLQKVVGSTDWDLPLSLPHGVVQDAEPAARTIN